MQYPWIFNAGWRRRAVAAVCAVLPALAGAQAVASQSDASAGGPNTVYSIINLGVDVSSFALNESGHAAFSALWTGQSSFFDGDDLYDMGSLGGSFTGIYALNIADVVVGRADNGGQNPDAYPAFKWTREGGMHALPSPGSAVAMDVNDHSQIVGAADDGYYVLRAQRWNADGSATLLGSPDAPRSLASAINNRGFATGFESAPNDFLLQHAMLWDPDGKPTDLGSLDSDSAAGMFINERGEVLGSVSHRVPNGIQGFFWSRDSGMVPIQGVGERMTGLNNHGVAVGNMVVDRHPVAFQWTLAHGLVPLPLGSVLRSRVNAIDDRGEMVGTILPSDADRRATRAARWPGMATPVDLNKQLHRPPAGLVLTSAEAINGRGEILAQSNAGLVMLRPGRRGTDAPVLGPLLGLPDYPKLEQEVALSLNFVDNDGGQTHTASAAWSDGCSSSVPTPAVSESGGTGQARWRHVFCVPGLYSLTLRVTDSGGRHTELIQHYSVAEPNGITLSGQGMLADAAGGRWHKAGPLRFALWTPLGGVASIAGGAGQPVVNFYGPFHFRGEQLSSAAATAQGVGVEGRGRLDGRGGYRFLLEAADGGAAGGTIDRLRVRLMHTDAATGAEVVDYDNGAPASVAGVDGATVAQGRLTLRRAK